MRCTFCKSDDSKVTNSRNLKNGTAIRRRRECNNCGRRFTTYERIEVVPVIVVKSDQSRELFDEQKILKGLLRACEKRSITLDILENFVSEIECYIYNNCSEREISSSRIGELVLERLKAVDEVAYIRFASVYRRFNNIESFLEELKSFGQKQS